MNALSREREVAVLAVFQPGDELTRTQIEARTGLSATTVVRALAALEGDGRLVKKQVGPGSKAPFFYTLAAG
ncbi:MAG: MarR family transcriptional regulator [Myxococcales bacterium]|nr:MarR family transcriptional regulator [Myxococcales bacterium]